MPLPLLLTSGAPAASAGASGKLAKAGVKREGLTLPLHLTELEDDLPQELYALLDPSARVALPQPGATTGRRLDNWKLDKLVSQLGKSKATWRRALVLYEWLKDSGHKLDDRLCTTLIRMCADQRDAMTALAVYEWMRAPGSVGGGDLRPTVFTYTAVMRAALNGALLERAMGVWDDAQACGIRPDSRLCVIFMEVCARLGQTDRALGMYAAMRAGPPRAPCAPTVHAYTAAMRAASEGRRWAKALDIWHDMREAACVPTAHAYAAVISACACGRAWQRAVALFEEMSAAGITPDVVSCTALVSALASGGEADKAEAVVQWMLRTGLRPNVRTYTALMSAMASAKQCTRAVEVLYKMQLPEWGSVSPNAYTYSVLIKALGDNGYWQLAEAVFASVEQSVLALRATSSADATTSGFGGGGGAYGAPAAHSGGGAWPAGAGGGAAQLQAEAAPRAPAWASASLLNGIELDIPTAIAGGAAAGSDAHNPTLDPQISGFGGFGGGIIGGGGGAGGYGGFGGIGVSGGGLCAPASGGPAGAMPPPLRAPGGGAFTPGGALSGLAVALRAPPTPRAPPAPIARPAARQAPAAAGQAPAPGGVDSGSAAVRGGSTGGSVAIAPGQQQLPGGGGASGSAASASGDDAVVNEVVCGALMTAYERAGMWAECIGVLSRSQALGLQPNVVMYNTAISAAGKAGQLELAESLFARVRRPDGVTHESLIAAYGLCGQPTKAEAALRRMSRSGFQPRDYAYCGLIAAYSLAGDTEGALAVLRRVRSGGGQASIHVYNALLAACERGGRAETGLKLLATMSKDGLEPNAVTNALMSAVGRRGVQSAGLMRRFLRALESGVYATPRSHDVFSRYRTEELKLNRSAETLRVQFPEGKMASSFAAKNSLARATAIQLSSFEPPLAKRFALRQAAAVRSGQSKAEAEAAGAIALAREVAAARRTGGGGSGVSPVALAQRAEEEALARATEALMGGAAPVARGGRGSRNERERGAGQQHTGQM
ncbi:hypothetical protein FOA52_011043 [Chlamydomonas sp. UWO 241]|nr:hypothetical protein FOA52_011043 [Chlamydomonas sp. UWO 241]